MNVQKWSEPPTQTQSSNTSVCVHQGMMCVCAWGEVCVWWCEGGVGDGDRFKFQPYLTPEDSWFWRKFKYILPLSNHMDIKQFIDFKAWANCKSSTDLVMASLQGICYADSHTPS